VVWFLLTSPQWRLPASKGRAQHLCQEFPSNGQQLIEFSLTIGTNMVYNLTGVVDFSSGTFTKDTNFHVERKIKQNEVSVGATLSRWLCTV
jgi:hypothetical protein